MQYSIPQSQTQDIVYTKMDALTKQTSERIMAMMRDINPHKGQPSNIQLAWATGYLVGLMASLCQDDSHVKYKVYKKLKESK